MKIIVNGVEHEYSNKSRIGYVEIMSIVRGGGLITYHWQGPGGAERSGTILPGKSIVPVEGMIFSVFQIRNG